MNEFSILIWCTVVLTVIGACLLDLLIESPFPRHFRNRRFFNWFVVGFTYALSYFGRYNINVLNVKSIHEMLHVSNAQFGWVITIGFWVYAFFVFFNGMVVDRIGARKGVLYGVIGSGIMNLVMGIYGQFFLQTGTAGIVWICILFGINNYWQTYSTSAIVKFGVNWYVQKERGFFTSIFGIIIAFGLFLAFQVNGLIFDTLPWYYLFYIPSATMFVMTVVCYYLVRATPIECGYTPETLPMLYNAEGLSSSHMTGVLSIEELAKRVFKNPFFITMAITEVCIGWCRDGVLTWYVSYIRDFWHEDSTSIIYSIAAGGITIGAMFGSLSAGIISDKFFHSRRPPVAMYACLGLTFVFLWLYSAKNVTEAALLVAFTSYFFSAAHGIVTSATAMDFAGGPATGTAVGFLDGIQKLASGCTGSFMGAIVDSDGYSGWVMSMIPASILAVILLATVYNRKAPAKETLGAKNAAPAAISDAESARAGEKQPLIADQN